MTRLFEYFRNVWNGVAASALIPKRQRWRILKAAGLGVERSTIEPGCYFGGRKITIGAGSYINHEVFFDASAPIAIGRGVHIAMRAMLLTSSHRLSDGGHRAGEGIARAITVADGAWIQAGATILPGVTVGARSVVMSGAVVTKDVPPDHFASGVPAAFRPIDG